MPIGTHSISAEYAGDATYLTSTGSVAQAIIAAPTTINVTANPTQGTARRAITFAAHVAPGGSGSGIPTGEVFFTDLTTGKVLGSALDENGNASSRPTWAARSATTQFAPSTRGTATTARAATPSTSG